MVNLVLAVFLDGLAHRVFQDIVVSQEKLEHLD